MSMARPKSAKQPAKRRTKAQAPGKRWSQHVTETSAALNLERDVFTFTSDDPRAIAQSLKRSAERSRRRKSSPYRSAMSMLVFYINRAGKNLSKRRLDILEQAKAELRKAFDRDPG